MSEVLKEIRLRDVKQSVWEDKDLFPYPPPVECEWRYMARYYKLGHRSEACRQLALKWANVMKIFSLENEAEASVKTMWAISGRSAIECYRYLRRTVSQLQKIRSAGDYELERRRNLSIVQKFKLRVEIQEAINDFARHALKDWNSNQNDQLSKCLCAKCGMNMLQKCKQCSMCSVRYCSRNCQKSDWTAHKETCSGHKVVRFLDAKLETNSDDDSDF